MNTDRMPAGREMDALVAEEVMGRIPCDKWTPVLHPEAGWLKNCQCQACYPVDNPAYYSTNIAAAWQIVEHLARADIYLCIFDQLGYAVDEETGDITNDRLFRVEFMNVMAHEREEPSERIWYGVAEAVTTPLAICRAALKVVVECKEEIVKVDCQHEFFKCQVPAGDSCVAIYHQVCRKCRWDKRKGIYMPLDIWRGWAVPQLQKKQPQ